MKTYTCKRCKARLMSNTGGVMGILCAACGGTMYSSNTSGKAGTAKSIRVSSPSNASPKRRVAKNGVKKFKPKRVYSK